MQVQRSHRRLQQRLDIDFGCRRLPRCPLQQRRYAARHPLVPLLQQRHALVRLAGLAAIILPAVHAKLSKGWEGEGSQGEQCSMRTEQRFQLSQVLKWILLTALLHAGQLRCNTQMPRTTPPPSHHIRIDTLIPHTHNEANTLAAPLHRIHGAWPTPLSCPLLSPAWRSQSPTQSCPPGSSTSRRAGRTQAPPHAHTAKNKGGVWLGCVGWWVGGGG